MTATLITRHPDALTHAYATLGTHELRAARRLLTRAVTELARNTAARHGVVPIPRGVAPDNWAALRHAWEWASITGELPVWNGATETSVYRTACANVLFRFWHDAGHCEHELNFTPAHETWLQTRHHIPAMKAELARHSLRHGFHHVPDSVARALALELYHADTIGQIEYIAHHGNFPADQLAFDCAYVIDPASALAGEF